LFDVLISGGIVLDGTGSVGFRGDVAIVGDQLKILTGDTSSVPAANTIDATHCVVAPGFVDVHAHSDLKALSEPFNEPKIMQGVCTELAGLDGIGYAPLSRKNLEMMLLAYSGLNGYPELDYGWSSVAEYLQRFFHNTSGNVAFLVPQGCLRAEAIGWKNRPATQEQIKAMQEMIRRGMAEGAVGLSTGLSYPPGVYASTSELIELCKTVRECGGVYVTHVRYDLGDCIFDPFREAVEIGLRSGCPVHFSHYQANMPLRGQTDRMLEFVDAARANGVDLTFEVYPYDGGGTTLTILLPLWVQSGGPGEIIKRLQDRDVRAKLRHCSTDVVGPPEGLIIRGVKSEKNRWCEGLSIVEIASRLKKDLWDTICDLMLEEELEVMFYALLSDLSDLRALLNHPAQMFSSDGLRVGGMPNPAAYGTYPRVLGQFVRDERVLSMEEAIRKMTSFPALRFGLTDRGLLRDGMKADVVVFNPTTVSAVSTLADPKRFPLGIDYVFVNGKMVVEKGNHTGLLPGEPLKRSTYAA